VTYEAENKAIFEILNAILEGTGLFATLSENRKVILIKEKQVLPVVQQETITGTVTDARTGVTMLGVNILVKGTSTGTATDPDGQYEVTVESLQDTLVFSSIGFQSQEVPINGRSSVDIAMQTQVISGEELVVTALGIERRERSLGYSTQQVKAEELVQSKETNFVTSLTGKVAGANITSANSMGGSSRIVIRGAKSITGNNQPLFVIDGVPLDNSNFTNETQATGSGGYDFGNAASMINPNNIKSVTILKGANAAALYGSRARNGVIQITTKDGSGGQGIGVSINSSVQFSEVYALPEYQNKYGGGPNAPFIQEDGQLFVQMGNDESWGPRLDGRMVRQWYSFDDVNGLNGQATPWVAHPGNVKDFFNTGVSFNNDVSLSKGGEDYSYRLSFSRLDKNGVYPESQLERNQIGFNGRADFSENLTGAISVNYSYEDVTGRPGTGYDNENVFLQFNQFGQRQVDLGPNSYMADYARPDGSQRAWNWNGIAGANSGDIRFTDNPYWVRNKNYEKDDTQRIYGNANITYDFTDYLNVKGAIVTDYYTTRRGQRVAINSQTPSSYQENIYEVEETNGKLIFNLNRDLNDDLNLTVLAGGNIRYNDLNQNNGETTGSLISRGIYTLENSRGRPAITDYYQQKQVYSLFANATLGYQETLYLASSLRNDWSSTLPADNNSYLYPSITGSFIFTELDGLNNSDILSFGKLRLGYAQTGSDTDPYRLASTLPLGSPFGNVPIVSLPTTLNNSNLKPEITSSYEVGANLEFFSNRASLDITYYNSKTKDQIIPIDVSSASGYENQVINAGEISNRGLEAAISVTPVQMANSLSWDISANWAKNINKVEELAPGVSAISIGNVRSITISAREGQPYGQIIGSGDFVYDENGNKVVGSNGLYLINNEPQVLGNYVPDWTAGVSSTISYKGFTASIALDGQKGGDIWSQSAGSGLGTGIFKATAENDIRQIGVIADGVQQDGSSNTVQTTAEQFFSGLPTAAFVYDASYIKLRELRLAYNLPNTLFKNVSIQGLTVSVIGRNLATLFKNSAHIDPVSALSAGNVQGVELGQIPPQRTFGFNVSIDL
jgi:TonB-linked SusC/RagA family outer membrane protein